MMRYLRVLRVFWSTAVAAEMEYRANFAVAALSSLGHLGANLFALFLFYRTGASLGGWSWDQALVVLGIFTTLQGFSDIVLNPNLSRIVVHVQRGTLDFILLKPIDSQFYLSTRNLSPWGFPDVVFGLGILLYAIVRLRLPVANLALGIVPVLLALVVLYSLWYLLATTTIWFVKIYNVTEVLRNLLEAGRFPISAYPTGYRVFFTFVVPVAFLTTVPAQTLLGQGSVRWLLGALALAIALFAASRWFWRFALRSYTSASS